MKGSYLAITDDEQYYTCQVDFIIIKCQVYEGHYYSLSGGYTLLMEITTVL